MAQPPWLQGLLEDTTTAPHLFAWTPANLGWANTAARSSAPAAVADADRRIYVLGIGNLGVLFATALASVSNRPPITLVMHRKELLESWAENPVLEMSRLGAVERFQGFDVEWWTEEKPEIGEVRSVGDGSTIRNLIVTTKAPAALSQVDRIRRYLDETSTVAFAQNGMCKLWPPYGETYNAFRYPAGTQPNWLACVTTHGVTSRGRFRSEHASEADLKIGPVLLNPSGTRSHMYLAEQLMQPPRLHGKAVSSRELWVLQLEKLIVNAIINPLTALLRCKNGELFKQEDGPLVTIIDHLLLEASAVLQQLVRHASADPILSGSSSASQAGSGPSLAPREALVERFSYLRLRGMLLEVGHKVRDNTSSMLQDVQAGKQTEIRDFNGWLVDMANVLGGKEPMTTHRTVIDLVEKGIAIDRGIISRHFPNIGPLHNDS